MHTLLPMRTPARLFIAFALLYTLTYSGYPVGDEVFHQVVAHNTATHGDFSLPEMYSPKAKPGMKVFAREGRNGQIYLTLPPALAAVSVPFALIGSLFADAEPQDVPMYTAEPWIGTFVGLVNPLVSALIVVVFFCLCRRRSSERVALMGAAVLGCATMLWPYATTHWTQPLATLMTLVAIWRVLVGQGDSRLRPFVEAGVACGFGLFCRIDTLLVWPWLALFIAASPGTRSPGTRSERLQRLAGFFAPIAAAGFLSGLWNWYRFGAFTESGAYHVITRDLQLKFLLEGLPFNLVSPNQSLFLFSPILVAGLVSLRRMWRTHRLETVLCAGTSVTYVLFFSAFVFFETTPNWGPRFLLPIVPLLLWPLFHARETVARTSPAAGQKTLLGRRLVTMLVALSVLVQVLAITYPVGVSGWVSQTADWSKERELPWFWSSEILVHLRELFTAGPDMWFLQSAGHGVAWSILALALMIHLVLWWKRPGEP